MLRAVAALAALAVLLLAAQGARLDTPFGRLGLDPRSTLTFGVYGPPPPAR